MVICIVDITNKVEHIQVTMRLIESFPEVSESREKLQKNKVFKARTLELESLELREKVASLEKCLVDQKAIIDERWDAEKRLRASYDEKAADFRADLLKVKAEKNKLTLKVAKTELERCKETQQTLIIENGDLKCKLKSKDSEITAVAKENTKLKSEIRNLQKEVTTVKTSHERDLEKAQEKFKCHICDQYLEGQLQIYLYFKVLVGSYSDTTISCLRCHSM